MSNKKSIFSKISTKPSPDSLKWAGTQYSLLSNILLWALWICRVFSLLQISKYVFRTIATAIKKATTDKNATRVNVPPMFCEFYFIIWFAVLLIGYLLGWTGLAFRIATIYYLFESIVWVLYYTVFRRFYEENYSIYHELEYLTVLFILIPTEALGFASLYGENFKNMLTGLLGAGIDSTPFPVRLVGALFAAIVISMIISTFPSERVKKRVKKSKMHLIGGGDVVQKRLHPALVNSNVEQNDVHVYDISSNIDRLDGYTYLTSDDEIIESIKNKVKAEDVIWIETPPHTHFKYLDALLSSKAKLIAIEKPISISSDELDKIESIVEDDEKRNKIFFLSYYILEKALPLYYLAQPNPNYEKYLEIEDKNLIQNCRPLLGALTSIKVDILEGEDKRSWIDDNQCSQLLETFLHNVLIASLFCGLPEYWKDVKLNKEINGRDCDITMTASCGHTNIDLRMKKDSHLNSKKRTATLTFTNGSIVADFDSQSLVLAITDLDIESRITTKHRYMDKYLILVDLVKRATNGIPTDNLDGLKNQIAVIRWLLKQ